MGYLIFATVPFCLGAAIGEPQTRVEDEGDVGVDPGFGSVDERNSPLKFAAFNIQIFGKKKMQQQDIVDVLVKILLRYDLILIQEIRDSEEKWTQELLNVLNGKCHATDKYEMILSDRLGRTSSKEQYGFFFRSRLLTVKGSFHFDDGEEVKNCITEKQKQAADKKAQRKAARLRAQAEADADKDADATPSADDAVDEDVDDEDATDPSNVELDEVMSFQQLQQQLTEMQQEQQQQQQNETLASAAKDRPICTDTFQREPFVVRFQSKTTVVKDFSVIACHTDPDEAVKEIDALYDVYRKVKSKWGTTEVIIAGDLNADGAYMPKKYWPDIRLRNERYWNWLIPDNADTTTGRSNCAYDRFIISKRGRFENGGIIKESAQIFDFQNFFGLDDELTLRVSDHYPIEVQLQPEN